VGGGFSFQVSRKAGAGTATANRGEPDPAPAAWRYDVEIVRMRGCKGVNVWCEGPAGPGLEAGRMNPFSSVEALSW
jgi:hypothetical protein